MPLTLVVPELIWPEPDDRATLDDLSCPGLTALLARSRLTQRPPQSFEATLTDLFGIAGSAAYAAFRALGEEHGPPEARACWVCADPVHLRLHQERLILAEGSRLAIERAEAEAIVGDLNRHFANVGRFHAVTPERWYLELDDQVDLGHFDVLPLSAAAGRRVTRQLPETPEARWLRQLLVEAQMILHRHPANEAREAAGQSTINSLWFWGAGVLPAATVGPFSTVCCRDPLTRGLARASGRPTRRPPETAEELLVGASDREHPLVVLDDLQRAVQYEDGAAWRDSLADLERRWFAPLRAALTQRRIRCLRLESSTAYAALAWESRYFDQWKLWCRARSVAALAESLGRGER
ncbi:hypothetical protein [Accumulibacter sp.]|uniref:hypothetical protein n=1 Tax=Accumulibacter sp. TaxID=2053492 RepID=UPI0025EABF40|nr:hypothetical protein [Accumulibacter sp.]MCM8595264.1 hypothetical protein [Accumulibacter sp.]MCM8627733.1 hypothetical protein [Accumulibacter sp.]MDS4049410.1 hypothetical protein [Accumulibacter sp.]